MRETIQEKLNELEGIEVSTEIPDDMLESNQTYFSFSYEEDFLNTDFENNFTKQVNVIGYVKRLQNSNENTLKIVDNATIEIINKLKELNIRSTGKDVSTTDNVIKRRITGKGKYNEINNQLV